MEEEDSTRNLAETFGEEDLLTDDDSLMGEDFSTKDESAEKDDTFTREDSSAKKEEGMKDEWTTREFDALKRRAVFLVKCESLKDFKKECRVIGDTLQRLVRASQKGPIDLAERARRYQAKRRAEIREIPSLRAEIESLRARFVESSGDDFLLLSLDEPVMDPLPKDVHSRDRVRAYRNQYEKYRTRLRKWLLSERDRLQKLLDSHSSSSSF